MWGISQGALVINAAAALAAEPNRPDPAFSRWSGRPGDTVDRDVELSARGGDVAAPDGVGDARSCRDAIQHGNHRQQLRRFQRLSPQLHPVAVLNALAGLVYRHGQDGFVDLASVPAENISVTVNAYGATTTTYRVPSTALDPAVALTPAVPKAWVDALDRVLQPMVDAGTRAHRRPPPAAAPAAVAAPARPSPVATRWTRRPPRRLPSVTSPSTRCAPLRCCAAQHRETGPSDPLRAPSGARRKVVVGKPPVPLPTGLSV